MPGSSFDILCIPSCSFSSISHLILLLSDPDADSSSQVRSLPPSLPSAQTVPASPKRLPASVLLKASFPKCDMRKPLHRLIIPAHLDLRNVLYHIMYLFDHIFQIQIQNRCRIQIHTGNNTPTETSWICPFGQGPLQLFHHLCQVFFPLLPLQT